MLPAHGLGAAGRDAPVISASTISRSADPGPGRAIIRCEGSHWSACAPVRKARAACPCGSRLPARSCYLVQVIGGGDGAA
jgi:hypothetical protein